MNQRPGWEEYFLNIAEVVSTRSHDLETHVGCVVVSEDHRILSTGYNGFPPGFPDESLPRTRPQKYPYMIHAEANAIASAYGRDLRGSTLYCTHSPCGECTKLILAASIGQVICKRVYVNADWEFIKTLFEMSNTLLKVKGE